MHKRDSKHHIVVTSNDIIDSKSDNADSKVETRVADM